MVRIEVKRSEIEDIKVRPIFGQEGSWRKDELYNDCKVSTHNMTNDFWSFFQKFSYATVTDLSLV